MSKLVTIPEFVDGDAASMAVALRAMKQILESLSGARQDESKGSPAVYVQAVEPKKGKNLLNVGDLWFSTATHKMHCYNLTYWQEIG